MQQQPKKKLPKPTIPLMELLAYNSTAPARLLLKKYGQKDANGYDDLKEKLSDLYANEKDKLAIEKEFAEIHPHKDFILKHLCPPPVETKVILKEPTTSLEGPSAIIGEDPALATKREFLIASVAIVGIVALVIYATKR